MITDEPRAAAAPVTLPMKSRMLPSSAGIADSGHTMICVPRYGAVRPE
jgi:hypothetical protein